MIAQRRLRHIHFFDLQIVEPGRPRALAEPGEEHGDARPAARRRLEVDYHFRPVRVAAVVRPAGDDAASARHLYLERAVDRRPVRVEAARPHPAAQAVRLSGGQHQFLAERRVRRLGGRDSQRLLAFVGGRGVRLDHGFGAVDVDGPVVGPGFKARVLEALDANRAMVRSLTGAARRRDRFQCGKPQPDRQDRRSDPPLRHDVRSPKGHPPVRQRPALAGAESLRHCAKWVRGLAHT